MRRALVCLCSLVTVVVAGCSTLPVAQMSAASPPVNNNVKFIDERTSPSAGPFMFAEGNIFSCHYGIKKIGPKAMQPDRMALLHSYLANQIFSGAQEHTAVVKRFDIYWNQDVALRHQAGLPFALAGEAAASAATSGVVLGCKNAEEGEYYSAEVPPGNYSAIVVYLRVVLDGQTYNVRTAQPLLEDSTTKSQWPAALADAVNKTFGTLAGVVRKG